MPNLSLLATEQNICDILSTLVGNHIFSDGEITKNYNSENFGPHSMDISIKKLKGRKNFLSYIN